MKFYFVAFIIIIVPLAIKGMYTKESCPDNNFGYHYPESEDLFSVVQYHLNSIRYMEEFDLFFDNHKVPEIKKVEIDGTIIRFILYRQKKPVFKLGMNDK